MAVTYLNTKEFNEALEAFKKGIQTYNTIRSNVSATTNTLFLSWFGEGKTQFEKDYTTIYRQLSDISDILYDLYDSMVDAQAEYIRIDEELSKQFTV